MVISYSYQGQSKTQQIMSFANPAVYAAVPGFKSGDMLDVEITKNDQGYNTWASVKLAETGSKIGDMPKMAGASPARTTYETPEERAKKQVYIIKQSSLANAVASYGDKVSEVDVAIILDTAQKFTDWVMDDGTEGEPQD